MATKIVTLKEAFQFVENNGYLLAVYKKQGKNYILDDEFYSMESEDENEKIVVRIVGTAIDFNEFVTEDRLRCFRLHNNLNVPNIIPIFDFPDN